MFPYLLAGVVVPSLAVILAERAGFGRAAVALATGVAIFFGLTHVELAVWVYVAVSCFDGLLKGWLASTQAIFAKDLFLAVAMAACLLTGRIRSVGDKDLRPLLNTALVFAVWVAGEVFNPEASSITASLAGARSWLIWLPGVFIAREAFTTPERTTRFLWWVVILAAASAFHGLMQHVYGSAAFGLVRSQVMEERIQMYGFIDEARERHLRVFGPTVHPGALGAFLALTLPLVAGLFLSTRSQAQRLLLISLGGLIAIGLVLTASRAPTLAVLLSGAFMFWWGRRSGFLWPMLTLGLIVTLLGARVAKPALHRVSSALSDVAQLKARVALPMQSAVYLMSLRPLLGHGLDTGVGVPEAWRKNVQVRIWGLENEYARALGEMGLPGMVLYMLVIWQTLKLSWRCLLRSRDGPHASLACGLFATILQGPALQMVGPVLYVAPAGPLFWALVGALVSLTARIPVAVEELGQTPSTAVPALAAARGAKA